MPTPSPLADAYAPSKATSGDTVQALYRAALGPVQQQRYLALFERFDQTGRAPVGWNFSASLATLNWMLLHHLWSAALIYVALVEGLALLVFGVGRPLLHWPAQVEWGLIAAFALFAIVLPGLFGDALLYSEIRKRMARALVAAHSIPEACTLLARQAGSWRRLVWIAAANALLFLAIAAAWLWVPADGWSTAGVAPAPVASGAVQSTVQETRPAPEAAAPAANPARPVDADPPIAVPPPSDTATLETAAPSDEAEHAEPGNTQVQAGPSSAPLPAQQDPDGLAPKASTPPPAPAPTAPAAVPAPVKAPPTESATAATATPAARKAIGEAQPTSQPAPVGSAPGYYLNVGLFAQEANARRAQAKLLDANLPAFRQTFATAQGERTRVRVGPFDTEAQAQKAAAQIRSMQLDAVMYQQRG